MADAISERVLICDYWGMKGNIIRGRDGALFAVPHADTNEPTHERGDDAVSQKPDGGYGEVVGHLGAHPTLDACKLGAAARRIRFYPGTRTAGINLAERAGTLAQADEPVARKCIGTLGQRYSRNSYARFNPTLLLAGAGNVINATFDQGRLTGGRTTDTICPIATAPSALWLNGEDVHSALPPIIISRRPDADIPPRPLDAVERRPDDALHHAERVGGVDGEGCEWGHLARPSATNRTDHLRRCAENSSHFPSALILTTFTDHSPFFVGELVIAPKHFGQRPVRIWEGADSGARAIVHGLGTLPLGIGDLGTFAAPFGKLGRAFGITGGNGVPERPLFRPGLMQKLEPVLRILMLVRGPRCQCFHPRFSLEHLPPRPDHHTDGNECRCQGDGACDVRRAHARHASPQSDTARYPSNAAKPAYTKRLAAFSSDRAPRARTTSLTTSNHKNHPAVRRIA